MNILAALAGCSILAAAGGAVTETLLERRDRRRYPPPGQIVSAGGSRIHLVLAGTRQSGDPLVVLETGMGSWSFYWRKVQPAVAQFTRVCSYDRPGFGWSPPGSKPRSPEQSARELHLALLAAGEPGPYLLVGHSLGGVLVRQFARLFSNQVAGMVLVDSAHEDQLRRMPWASAETHRLQSFFSLLAILHRVGILRLLGKKLLQRFTSLESDEEKRLFLSVLLASRYFETIRDETWMILNPIPVEQRLVSLDDRPLVVIQAGGQPQSLPRGYTAERWQMQRSAWDSIQQDLLSLSSRSRLVIAEKSLHAVQLEQPELVIEAIEEVYGFRRAKDARPV